jgi:hypothetical protein
MELRCHLNQDRMYPLERYVNGLRALRFGSEQLVQFSVIAGILPATVYTQLEGPYSDLAAPHRREMYYETVLSQLRPAASGGALGPSCSDPELGEALPPFRLTETARQFGENGLLLSICEPDFGLTIDAIAGHIGRRTGKVCPALPISWPRSGGLDCEVLWQLPTARTAPPGTPTSCETPSFEFLTPDSRPAKNGELCRVQQVPRQWDNVGGRGFYVDGSAGDGWYYDDFSDELAAHCRRTSTSGGRVAFTPGAEPPPGVRVYLDCSEAALALPEP